MVAAICRVASTLPEELRQVVNFGNGETQVLQVTSADTHRNDAIFHHLGKVYCVEFKKNILKEQHIHESFIFRRYHLSLKAKYGDRLAGIVFVGEVVEKDLTRNLSESLLLQTWGETIGTPVIALSLSEFARTLITKAIKEVLVNPYQFSLYTLCQLPLQMHALTTASDGYPEWFTQEWLERVLDTIMPITNKR